jgi:hypothetical protein
MNLLASWGFTPALQMTPQGIGGRPDMLLPVQCWALPGLHWQLLAWAAAELRVQAALPISDDLQQEEVRGEIALQQHV